MSAQTPALSTVHHPLGRPGGPGLFRVKNLQLPAYIQNIAAALERNGRTESQAIQLAIGACRRWAKGSGKVSPEVRAAAAKALAEWEQAKATDRAHSHANDTAAVELAGAFNAALHPRVAKGHGNAGQFGSQGTNLKAAPGAGGGYKPAAPAAAGAPAPEPPAEAAQIAQLRSQAEQDRQLARQIFAKADALVRIRAGYIAGLLTPTGKVKGATAGKAVSAKRSAAAKKAAATRKATPRKARAKSSTKGAAAATKAANVAKLSNQISLLRHDANALIQSASHLDQLANKL